MMRVEAERLSKEELFELEQQAQERIETIVNQIEKWGGSDPETNPALGAIHTLGVHLDTNDVLPLLKDGAKNHTLYP